jgi:hypothetical protein
MGRAAGHSIDIRAFTPEPDLAPTKAKRRRRVKRRRRPDDAA